MYGDRCLRLVGTLVVVTVLMIAPVAQEAGADKGVGPGGGGAGLQRPNVIVVLQGTMPGVVERHYLSQIKNNWDKKFKLIVPNSNPVINEILVQISRLSPSIAATYVSLLSRNKARSKIIRRIKENINLAKAASHYFLNKASAETAKGARGDHKIVIFNREISVQYQVTVTRLEELLRAMQR